MLQNLLLKTLRDQRIAVLAYGLGLGALALLLIAIYPSFAASGAELEEAMKNLPDAYKAFTGGVLSLTEFDGYLVSQYLIILPLILAIFGIIEGTGALRGEEERGTMDTLLSLPISRSQVVIQKAIGDAIEPRPCTHNHRSGALGEHRLRGRSHIGDRPACCCLTQRFRHGRALLLLLALPVRLAPLAPPRRRDWRRLHRRSVLLRRDDGHCRQPLQLPHPGTFQLLRPAGSPAGGTSPFRIQGCYLLPALSS